MNALGGTLDLNAPPSRHRKTVQSLDELLVAIRAHRAAGESIVFTNGCFDLLHAGHRRLLAEAAALGNVLVVALNSDASVRRLKGPTRPIVCETDRAAAIAALDSVDYVIVFDDLTPHRLLGAIRPNVLVKGGTYTLEEVIGRETVESYGGRICLTTRLDGVSTTEIVEGGAANEKGVGR